MRDGTSDGKRVAEHLRQRGVFITSCGARPWRQGRVSYGYNRAIFPDDPRTPADRAEALRSTNPLQRFAKDLTNPLGFGGSK